MTNQSFSHCTMQDKKNAKNLMMNASYHNLSMYIEMQVRKKKKVKVLPFTVCCLQNNRNFWGLCLVHLSVYFFLCIRILSHLLLNSHHIVFRYLEIDAPDLLKLFSLVYSPQGVAIVSLLTQQASVI